VGVAHIHNGSPPGSHGCEPSITKLSHYPDMLFSIVIIVIVSIVESRLQFKPFTAINNESLFALR